MTTATATPAKKRSEKYEEARSSLPENLRPIFEQLYDEYRFAAQLHCGQPFVSPKVIAELVKAGWRVSGEPIEQWKTA